MGELVALAWLLYSPLYAFVDDFEINEIPGTLSLVYHKGKLREKHIAFPLKLHAKCYDMKGLQRGEAVVTNDGIECYLFVGDKPMYIGTRVKGSAKAYYRNGEFYTVSDYSWEEIDG